MDYKILSAPLDKTEHLFFVATCKHRTTFYKLAVAEQFDTSEPGGFEDYSLLLQWDRGTCTGKLYKNGANVWVCDNPQLQPELVFLIGLQIEAIKE